MHKTPEERGQGLVDYALILSLLVIVVIVVLVFFGEAVGNLYEGAISELVKAFS